MAQYKKNTPAAPTVMATPTSTKRLASASRRKPKVNHSSATAAASTATTPAARSAGGRPRRGAGAGAGPGAVGACSGSAAGSSIAVTSRHPLPGTRWGAAARPLPTRRSRRPAGLDVAEHALRGVGPLLHVRHHPGPEAAGADLRWHLVGGVEACGAVLQCRTDDLGRVGQDLVGVAVGFDVQVRRQPGRTRLAAHPTLDLLTGELLQEVADLGGVTERHRELAGDQRGLLIDLREREPVVVDARLGLRREEGVDEARLTVQPAVRRILEHRAGGVAECDRRRLVGTAEDVAVPEHDLPEPLGGRQDGRVV